MVRLALINSKVIHEVKTNNLNNLADIDVLLKN